MLALERNGHTSSKQFRTLLCQVRPIFYTLSVAANLAAASAELSWPICGKLKLVFVCSSGEMLDVLIAFNTWPCDSIPAGHTAYLCGWSHLHWPCGQHHCHERWWAHLEWCPLGLVENQAKTIYFHRTPAGRAMFLALGVPANAISTNPKILGCELKPSQGRVSTTRERSRLSDVVAFAMVPQTLLHCWPGLVSSCLGMVVGGCLPKLKLVKCRLQWSSRLRSPRWLPSIFKTLLVATEQTWSSE